MDSPFAVAERFYLAMSRWTAATLTLMARRARREEHTWVVLRMRRAGFTPAAAWEYLLDAEAAEAEEDEAARDVVLFILS